MPVIKKQLKPGDEEKRIATRVPDVSTPPTTKLTREWANSSPAEEVGGVLFMDFFLNGVDLVRRGVALAQRDGKTRVSVNLNELLPRALWLKLLSNSLLGYFDCDDEECLELLDGVEWVELSWEETYEDAEEEGPWITVYADDEFVGYAGLRDFFESWEAESLRWLIPQLGITPRKLRATLKQLMPEER